MATGRGQIPIIPETWNAVTLLVQNQCDAPWTVYFETALPALGEAAITLLTFGLDDVARGYFRPKGVRGGFHWRKIRNVAGRAPNRFQRGVPEIGEEIGKRLPGAERVRNRVVSDGVRHLWRIDGVLQRGLWYWMVADVTGEFLINWSTGIIESEFCRDAAKSSALYEGSGGGVVAIQGWEPMQANSLVYNRDDLNHFSSGWDLPAGIWFVNGTVQWTNTGNVAHEALLGIFEGEGQDDLITISDGVGVAPNEDGTMSIQATITGPKKISYQWRISQGTASGFDSSHLAIGQIV